MKEFIYSIYLGKTDWSDAVRTLDDLKWTEASSCENKMRNKSVDRQAAAVRHQQDPGLAQLVVLFLAAFVFHLLLLFFFVLFFLLRHEILKNKQKTTTKRDNPLVSIWDTSLHLLRNWPPGARRRRM